MFVSTRKLVIVSLAVLAGVLALGMTTSQDGVGEVVRASRFELVNATGEVVASLSTRDQGDIAFEWGKGEKRVEAVVEASSPQKLVIQRTGAGKLEILFGSDHSSIELVAPHSARGDSRVSFSAGKTMSGVSAFDAGGTSSFGLAGR